MHPLVSNSTVKRILTYTALTGGKKLSNCPVEHALSMNFDEDVHFCIWLLSGVRRKFSWGGFIQWHALFVTSQFDVIFMFPNQRCGEVC